MNVVLDVSEFQSVKQLDNLLRNADDLIVGVYIKATQGVSYRDPLADAFAQCCIYHFTPFGFYDFMTNNQAADQEKYFQEFVDDQLQAQLIPMVDCEGSYSKGAAGVQHWVNAYGGKTLLYTSLSSMPQYAGLTLPKWVAQYDRRSYYRPGQSELDTYRRQGYALWQFTDNYMGVNQDASVLLGDMATIKH